MERAAALYSEGAVVGFTNFAKVVTPDLAYTLELERYNARLVGMEEPSAVTLRVTAVFRPEADGWKIVHRHADPIAAPRPPQSVVQT
jgi:ketosteroid isomerase-like protein